MIPEDIYQERLLDHFRRPRNRGCPPGARAVIEAGNQICGDLVTISLSGVREGPLLFSFEGKGCMISQASASILCDSCSNLSASEANLFIEGVIGAMKGISHETGVVTGDCRALLTLRKFPTRLKCALLAWEAGAQCLKNGEYL